jgi:catechol 2,3-dioxygenase-like lactoylglutathione lyase family enzyme
MAKISGVHVLIYSKNAQRLRAFFRKTLGFSAVDAGRGWLIFSLPPAELGIHPTNKSGRHELCLLCDDIEGTVKELKRKGVRFNGPVVDQGWGLLTSMKIPGGDELALYEPRHPLAIKPKQRTSKSRKSKRRK